MKRRVEISEAKTRPSALHSEVEFGKDPVICRGSTPVARVTRISDENEHTALCWTLRRERGRRRAVTTSELLSWRHAGHMR